MNWFVFHIASGDSLYSGAFLVAAAWDGKVVSGLAIKSEKGTRARVANPWMPAPASVRTLPSGAVAPHTERGGILEFATQPGASYEIRPA